MRCLRDQIDRTEVHFSEFLEASRRHAPGLKPARDTEPSITGGQHMGIWIILVCVLTYVISCAWLFIRVSKHTARDSEERQIAAYEEVV
jgi:hypothetical protein